MKLSHAVWMAGGGIHCMEGLESKRNLHFRGCFCVVLKIFGTGIALCA
jgi:hypothetical protein